MSPLGVPVALLLPVTETMIDRPRFCCSPGNKQSIPRCSRNGGLERLLVWPLSAGRDLGDHDGSAGRGRWGLAYSSLSGKPGRQQPGGQGFAFRCFGTPTPSLCHCVPCSLAGGVASEFGHTLAFSGASLKLIRRMHGVVIALPGAPILLASHHRDVSPKSASRDAACASCSNRAPRGLPAVSGPLSNHSS
jgi:hypothetical protein